MIHCSPPWEMVIYDILIVYFLLDKGWEAQILQKERLFLL